jgi:hypothetical protein
VNWLSDYSSLSADLHGIDSLDLSAIALGATPPRAALLNLGRQKLAFYTG